MPLTDVQYQALIVVEIDLDPTNNPTLAGQIGTLWTKNDDRAFDMKLQYLYTKKDFLIWLLQHNWRWFKWTRGDVQKDYTSIQKQIKEALDYCISDIKALEEGLLSNLSPSTGLILRGTDKDKLDDWTNPFTHTVYDPVSGTY